MKKAGVICIIGAICIICLIGIIYILRIMTFLTTYESQSPEFNDTVSPSKQYSCFVDEIERNYQIRIMKGDEVSYADNEMFRMRDRFYLAWSPNEDVLWVYSGDMSFFYLYIENDIWVKETIGPNHKSKFEIPLYVKENAGPIFRKELKSN